METRHLSRTREHGPHDQRLRSSPLPHFFLSHIFLSDDMNISSSDSIHMQSLQTYTVVAGKTHEPRERDLRGTIEACEGCGDKEGAPPSSNPRNLSHEYVHEGARITWQTHGSSFRQRQAR